MTVIDVHAHAFPRLGRAEGRTLADRDEPWLRVHGDGTGMMMSGDREYRPVEEGLWDPGRRVADMDAAGVDVQAVSATPLMFGYAAEPSRAADWCDKQVRFDPDLWILEIEDRAGRAFVDEQIV